jgi:hypothetical protein
VILKPDPLDADSRRTMTLRRAALTLLSAFLLTAAIAAPAGAQATRTWVSGVGDDVNPCSRTAPCKTTAGAISKTAAGGEINALDPGGYGTVTITKAITVDFTATGSGGVLNSLTNGVIVNAPDDDVVLRGLDINGANEAAPTPPCIYSGLNGIRILSARSVRIEDTQIAQNAGAGIQVAPTASAPSVVVNRVDISNNCAYGIQVAPSGTGSATVMVRDTTISNSGTALSVAAGGHAWLTGTTIFGNALGLEPLGGGVIESYDGNRLVGNTVDGTPTVTHTNVGPQGPAGASGPQGPAGEPAIKLMVALSSDRVTAQAGKRITLRYAATAAARATLHVIRGGKRVARVKAKVKAGRNTIAWSGKIRRKAARAGRYTLTLVATAADGQTDKATARLRLKR